MVDISPLEQYIEEPDNFMISYIPHEINRLGLDRFLHISISALDASKVWDDGLRPIQTTSYIYVRAITEIVYTINTYVEEADRDIWFTNLITQHNANVEFEKLNPPVFYGGDKAEKKYKQKKTSNKAKEPKVRKQTVAQVKAEMKAAKINALSINLIPKKK